jgi:hypothetical protein
MRAKTDRLFLPFFLVFMLASSSYGGVGALPRGRIPSMLDGNITQVEMDTLPDPGAARVGFPADSSAALSADDTEKTFEKLVLGSEVRIVCRNGEAVVGRIFQAGNGFLQLRIEANEGFGRFSSGYTTLHTSEILKLENPKKREVSPLWPMGIGVLIGILLIPSF